MRWFLGLTVLFAVAITLALAAAADGHDPPSCGTSEQVPCLTSEGQVLAQAHDGSLDLLTLEDWRQEYADAQYELVPPFAGPGPVAP